MGASKPQQLVSISQSTAYNTSYSCCCHAARCITQPAGQGKSSAIPGAPSDKLEGGQALAGLQPYASDTESSSSGSGDLASHAKNDTLGPFF